MPTTLYWRNGSENTPDLFLASDFLACFALASLLDIFLVK